MAEEQDAVLLDVTRAGVAVVTLNRPEVHNAFNPIVIERLSEIFADVANSDGVRVVLIEGAGKSFSAGADLDWMKRAGHYTDDDNRADAADMAEMLWRLKTLPQPTIALVNGAAVGGGLGLISACDIAVAVKDAKFRFSEVHLGLTPATISPHVIEAIGPRWTRALFVTGESFDANFAHQIGLVQYVVEDRNELSETAEHLVKLVFKGAPGAIHDAKALVNDFGGHPITQEIRRDSARRIADRRASEEGKEGLTAFLEKRKPRWAE